MEENLFYENGIYLKNNYSTTFEKKNRQLSDIEINEVFALMSDIRSKTSSYNTMPSGCVFFVEFFFDIGCDIPLNIVSI